MTGVITQTAYQCIKDVKARNAKYSRAWFKRKGGGNMSLPRTVLKVNPAIKVITNAQY